VKPVIIDSEAIEELDGAVAYYEDQKVGLGLDFLVEECIWVVAIAHGKRRPDYWRRRQIE
jgi:toxin ParE1/3/4